VYFLSNDSILLESINKFRLIQSTKKKESLIGQKNWVKVKLVIVSYEHVNNKKYINKELCLYLSSTTYSSLSRYGAFFFEVFINKKFTRIRS
jgi:hypothetical protein